MKSKVIHKRVFIKIIALAVTIIFLCQNVVLANPNFFTSGERRVTSNKLAPKSQVKEVCEALERQMKQKELKGTPEEEKDAREFLAEKLKIEQLDMEYGNIDIQQLDKEFESIIKIYGYKPFKDLYLSAGENIRNLFQFGLPAVKKTFTEKELKEYWPDLVELGKAAGENSWNLFAHGLPAVKKTFTDEEFKEYWPDLVELGKTAGEKSGYLFAHGLPAVKKTFTDEEFKEYWPDLVKLGITVGEKSGALFTRGLPAVKTLITNRDSLVKIGNDLLKIFQVCAGAETNIAVALGGLTPLIEKYPLSWNNFIKPVVYNQTVGAYLCFQEVKIMYDMGAILSEGDLVFIREIIEGNNVRAYDILDNFIVKGVKEGIISKPISVDKDLINNYFKESPYAIIEIYQAYKSNPEDLKPLIAKCEDIHKKILDGDTAGVEKDPLFSAMLMHVFPPAVTTEREQYMNLYTQRPDRSGDTGVVPLTLQGNEFEVSTGKYILKDPSKPLDETSWHNILKTVKKVNREEKMEFSEGDIQDLGKELLESWQSNKLRSNREEILKKIYRYFRYTQGQTLPDTLGTIQNIMAVKQYVGDTMRDLVDQCTNKYKENNPEIYKEVINKMFKKPETKAKAVLGVVKKYSKQPEDGKTRLDNMLQLNDPDMLDKIWEEVKDMRDVRSIREVLKGITFTMQGGKEAGTITQILQGKEYKAMQGEVSAKYEFKESMEKIKLRCVVSKRKAHGVIGLNTGVCVAPDEKLWDNPNFMNVILFDEDNIAQGGMHIMIIEEDDGKKYLTLPGINPSIGLLSQVPADDIYNKLIAYAHELARELNCEGVLIPKNATIHSNRSEIQRVVSGKNYEEITLSKIHPFSYSPKYSLQECYVVPVPVKTFVPSFDEQKELKGTPEEEKEAREFLAEKIYIKHLDREYGNIIKLYGYKPFKDLYLSAGEKSEYLFDYALPALKRTFTKEELKEYWPDLVELGIAAGENSWNLFKKGLPALKKTFTKELKEYWPGLVELGIAAGIRSCDVFTSGMRALKKTFTDEELKEYWPDLVELGIAAGKNSCNLFAKGLPAVKTLITDRKSLGKIGKDLVELGKVAGENSWALFAHALPALKKTFTDEELKEYWPGLVELGIAAGIRSCDVFASGMRALKQTFTDEEFKEYWPDLVELGKAVGKNSVFLFAHVLPAVKTLITDRESLVKIGNDLVELGKAAGENSGNLFQCLPTVRTLITDRESLVKIGNDLLKIFQVCVGVESKTAYALEELTPLIEKYPLSWNNFIKPVVYKQTVGAFLCFQEVKKLYDTNAITSEDDFIFIREIIEGNSVRAYDILSNFIVKGVEESVISKPISVDKDLINNYFKESPYAIIEIYQTYKNSPENLEPLIAKCEDIHKKILDGDTAGVEKDPLFSAMLMHVFPPAVTTQREQYMNLYTQRPDRPGDTEIVPLTLQGNEFEVSTGRYILKDLSKPLDETSWHNILKTVKEVNKEEKMKFSEEDIQDLGKELLESWQSNKLRSNREEILKKIYRYFRYTQGQTLPDTLGTIQNIMAVKQYVGDTMRDLVDQCTNKYKENDPEIYKEVINKMFKKPETKAKAVLGVVKKYSKQPEEGKKRLDNMLQLNDPDMLDKIWEEVKDMRDVRSIREVLKGITFTMQHDKAAVTITQILQGKEYKAMQGEVTAKYEFKESMEKIKLRCVTSKRKAHGAIGLNMGVCVAPDEKLWDNPNFMNVILFDEDNIAQGGMHVLIIEEDDGKKYLTLPGINPSIGLLSQVPADDIYNKLIAYAHELARELNCEGVLIPTQAGIHSNRSEIQRVISGKNYEEITLSKIHPFSYDPYECSLQGCYVVPVPVKVQPAKKKDIDSSIKSTEEIENAA